MYSKDDVVAENSMVVVAMENGRFSVYRKDSTEPAIKESRSFFDALNWADRYELANMKNPTVY